MTRAWAFWSVCKRMEKENSSAISSCHPCCLMGGFKAMPNFFWSANFFRDLVTENRVSDWSICAICSTELADQIIAYPLHTTPVHGCCWWVALKWWKRLLTNFVFRHSRGKGYGCLMSSSLSSLLPPCLKRLFFYVCASNDYKSQLWTKREKKFPRY